MVRGALIMFFLDYRPADYRRQIKVEMIKNVQHSRKVHN